ncbi:insert subdomain of RNA polymerase alpha subunit [Ramaria rubella]|nr:insert subdomain of RNA polymerase alpha subunit [Ramaria rubella]
MALSSIDDPRRHVILHAERIGNIWGTDFPGHHPEEDHSWNLDWFTKNLVVKVQRVSARSCEFDIVGVDASVANALRRIIIAEVPTIAIEHAYVWNNTSVIVDEVLAHRLGLVPLNVDPSLIEMKEDNVATDRNTIVFRLEIECRRNQFASRGETDPNKLYFNSDVFTSHLKWQPQGEQAIIFKDKIPQPTNRNILLAKLRPGQEIDMEVHAIKGIGATHAKWSPVATASYRLHPHIRIKAPIPPASVPKFVSCFSPGVISTRKNDEDQDEPVVACARKDELSREVLRHEEFRDKVELSRIRDWFIFNIESEGPYAPERLLVEAVSVMRDKIAVVRKAIADLETGAVNADVDMG